MISDDLGGLDGLLNHVDGKRYTSKREYERAVRHAGCEIVGNETQTLRPADRPLKDLGRELYARLTQR